ncbi:MAG: trypsin-like peptidase domain-containing protein [Rhodothermales bacterium]
MLGETPGLWNPANAYTPTSLSCSINVACSEGAEWTDVIDATVHISTGCTGVLVNNTRQDGTPYILTAHHCGRPLAGDVLNWTFYFNFQSSTCADPLDTPPSLTLQGAVVRAAQGGAADYALLELAEPIPDSYNVTYAGWSIEDHTPSMGVVVGHPRSDIKKITIDNDPIKSLGSYYWDATFDHGSIEIGSSGSPLFNERHQLIGLVRSAIMFNPNACTGPGGDDNAPRIIFPKLSYSWNIGTPGQRLSDYLDPDGTGMTSLPSLGESAPSPWINEVNADAHTLYYREVDEFVEIAAPAGTSLDGYTLDVYSCFGGTAMLRSSHTLQPFTVEDDFEGTGFFVIGGVGLQAAARNQLFQDVGGVGSFTRLPSRPSIDLLPDGSGLLVLKDEFGNAVFDYQYETPGTVKKKKKKKKKSKQTNTPICPTDRTTRSTGDAPGSGSMGFINTASASLMTTASTATLVASPGQPNTASGASLARLASGLESAMMAEAPTAYTLAAAYPNPFNPQTQFSLSVAQTQHVQVAAYDMMGRRVALLLDETLQAASTRSILFEAGVLPSGVYLIRAVGEHFSASQTVTLLK